MKIRYTSTRLCLLSLVLLISIFLNGCSRSASHNGESIDSIHADEGWHVELATDSEKEQQSNEQVYDLTHQQSTQQVDRSTDAQVEVDQWAIDHDRGRASGNPETERRPGIGPETETETDVDTTDGDARNIEQPATAPVIAATNHDPTSRDQDVHTDQPTTQPTTASEQLEWDGDNTLTFGELYESVGVRGIELSDKLEALHGKEVVMNGYMAPPLTAGVRFFVLTKSLMAVCPFCSTDADWPTDIVVVYLPDGEELSPTQHPVKVTGKLDTGSYTDEDTGFVSLVRIYAEKVEVLK